MKKQPIFILSSIIIMLLILFSPVKADAQEINGALFFVGSKQYISGKYVHNMDVAPFVENGRTYLPIRYLAEALEITSANIRWDAATQTVLLTKEGYGTVSLSVGNTLLKSNISSPVVMDTAPLIRYDRVFLPARYVIEAFGENASWEPETNGILISRNNNQPKSTILPTPTYPVKPTASIDYEDKTPIPPYMWEYGGDTWTWAPNIPQWTVAPILEHYRSMPHPHSTQLDYVLTYCTDKDSLEILKGLADLFKRSAIKQGLSEYEIPSLAIAFVQSFPYVSDSVSSGYDEYPRYPMETLVERKGDCEDTAILTATILKELGYKTALIFLDNHCAVGIKGDTSLKGYYYTVSDTRYYYLETTDVGWQIGEMPENLKDQKAIVLPLP